jgi:hypothetical protein
MTTPHGTVHGERWRAEYHFDDGEHSGNPGWFVEYLTEVGDCVDDSQKIWHPALPSGQSPEAEAEVITIATAYLAKLEGGSK